MTKHTNSAAVSLAYRLGNGGCENESGGRGSFADEVSREENGVDVSFKNKLTVSGVTRLLEGRIGRTEMRDERKKLPLNSVEMSRDFGGVDVGIVHVDPGASSQDARQKCHLLKRRKKTLYVPVEMNQCILGIQYKQKCLMIVTKYKYL